MLELKNVSFSVDVSDGKKEILKNVNLTVGEGFTAFTGPNGGGKSTLAKIIAFVEEAQAKKAPISKTADRVAAVFVPSVMAIAVLAAAGWWAVKPQDISFAVKIFTSVLVIACSLLGQVLSLHYLSAFLCSLFLVRVLWGWQRPRQLW